MVHGSNESLYSPDEEYTHYHMLPPFGNDTANAHKLSKWKPIKNLVLPNEHSWNLLTKSILSFFHMAVVSHHKIQLKKSKPVKIGQNGSKYGIVYQKLAIFCGKGNK